MKSIYISSCVPDGGVWRCGFDGETLTKRDFSPVGRVMYTAREGDTIYAVSLEPDSLDSFVVQAKLTDGGPGRSAAESARAGKAASSTCGTATFTPPIIRARA